MEVPDDSLPNPSARIRQRLAPPLAAGTLTLTLTLLGVTLATSFIAHRPMPLGDAMWLAHPVIFAIVGAIILRKLPAHPIGWMFLGVGVFGGLSDAGATYAYLGTMRDLPWSAVAAWVGLWAWLPPMGLLALAFSRFPDGRPAGRFSGLVGTSAFWLSILMTFLYGVGFWAYRSPALAVDGADERISAPVLTVANALVPVFLLGAVVVMSALFLRFHRSRGVERQQLKWLGLVILVTVPSILISLILPANQLVAVLSDILGTPLWLAVGVGLGVLRYRLYDIDRIVSRTLSYALVTTALLGMYSTVVLAASAGVGSKGAPSWAVAAATLAAAGLFRPVRGRVQTLVDRRFNRTRFDAARATQVFAQQLRSDIDLQDVTSRLAGVVAETLEPAHLSLWLSGNRRDNGAYGASSSQTPS